MDNKQDLKIRGQKEVDCTKMRQSFFAKWDGEKFVYGQEAAELRKVNQPDTKDKD